jgi:hypothetical protein
LKPYFPRRLPGVAAGGLFAFFAGSGEKIFAFLKKNCQII